MSTYYDLYETPDPSGEGKKKPLHARVRSKGTITAKEFQERKIIFASRRPTSRPLQLSTKTKQSG